MTLALRPTTEELALHILKRVFEHTEGRLEWRTLIVLRWRGDTQSPAAGPIVCQPPFARRTQPTQWRTGTQAFGKWQIISQGGSWQGWLLTFTRQSAQTNARIERAIRAQRIAETFPSR